MPVVEPVLTLEKLRQLLDEGHESASLDYKEKCDLSETRDRVELAKDVAAMQVDGGFIVVGADDSGMPVRSLTAEEEKLFDEARLRKILAKWIPEPFEVRSAIHDVDEQRVALIYIGPNVSGLCVLQRDGQYKDTKVFRAGDVFVRHGSASERWRQDDVDRIVDKLIADRREAWRIEMRAEYEHLAGAGSGGRIVQGPTGAFTWQLDSEAFVEATLELFRANDDIPLSRFLVEAPGEAGRHISSGRLDDFETLLGRVSCVAALALTYGREEWFEQTMRALTRIYDLGFDARGSRRGDIDPEALWLITIEHVFAVGGLAVRLEQWNAVRQLAVAKGTGNDFDFYPSWLRHGLTMAARTGKLVQDGDDGRRVDVSLISRAATRVAGLRCLRPDVPEDDERILNSLCQFDALAALVVIEEMGKVDSKGFYTNFARFYAERTEPALVRLTTDQKMRSILFPSSDEDLAIAIAGLNEYARSEGFRYAGWFGFEDQIIKSFLQEHLRDNDGQRGHGGTH